MRRPPSQAAAAAAPTDRRGPTVNRRQAISAGLAGLGTAAGLTEERVEGQVSFGRTAARRDAASGEAPDGQSRLVYDAPETQTWRIGLRLETPVTCVNVHATFPIPMDWPEQTVRVTGKSIDPAVGAWTTRDLLEGARQVVLRIPRVPAGRTAELMFEFEIERSRILPPDKTDDLVIPQRTPRELRRYMGNSPYIDTTHRTIRDAWREIATQDAQNDWQRVEQIYEYVREHVRYLEGPIRTASESLQAGEGDCEEMTSLFVALSRNARVPARMVWIPGHCYPEFYLRDASGNGHWFPCQAAGTRQFGQMDEYRPVLQKGDKFKPPESRTPTRYAAEFFKCDKRGSRDPDPDFIREQLPG